jgi:hypothetical protein
LPDDPLDLVQRRRCAQRVAIARNDIRRRPGEAKPARAIAFSAARARIVLIMHLDQGSAEHFANSSRRRPSIADV